MTRFPRVGVALAFALLLASTAGGCGSAGKSISDSSGKDKLEEVSEMLKFVVEDNSKPPARLAELERVEPLLPLAASALRNGDIVYIWGAGLSKHATASSTVIAYEKIVPGEGGWVLMADGQVKNISATEFAAAPKAKP